MFRQWGDKKQDKIHCVNEGRFTSIIDINFVLYLRLYRWEMGLQRQSSECGLMGRVRIYRDCLQFSTKCSCVKNGQSKQAYSKEHFTAEFHIDSAVSLIWLSKSCIWRKFIIHLYIKFVMPDVCCAVWCTKAL